MPKMQSEKQDKKQRKWLFLTLFFLFTALCIVFSVLCLYGTMNTFLIKNRAWLIPVVTLALCGFCAVCVCFSLRDKETLSKTFISVYIFLLFCLVLIFIFQKTGFFKIVNSPEQLQAYIEKSGAWMPALYILLQYLQVVILPIPSVVSTVAGVALFGPFKTMLYSLLGILLGSATAFFIGRKLGFKAVAWIVGEETLVKWQKKLKGKDNLFLTIMFLLPMFPDDILCFIAGLSSMSTKYFFIMIFISRVLAVAGTCYSFEFIPFDTWWGLTIWGVFILSIITAFVLIYRNMDKIQKKLQSMKSKRKNRH